MPASANRGQPTLLRLAIRYPKGKDKITTWVGSALEDIGSLIFLERAMSEQQLKLFQCGSNWRHNPTLIKQDRSGVDKAICAQDSSKRPRALLGRRDKQRGHIYQLDIHVYYPDHSDRLETYDEAWVDDTAGLILSPLAGFRTSSNWKQNPAILRLLPDKKIVGLCAKVPLPRWEVPPLPYGIEDCGLKPVGSPSRS